MPLLCREIHELRISRGASFDERCDSFVIEEHLFEIGVVDGLCHLSEKGAKDADGSVGGEVEVS